MDSIPLPTAWLDDGKLEASVRHRCWLIHATRMVQVRNEGGNRSNKAVFTIVIPVPSLAALSPDQIEICGNDFDILLIGSRFLKSSVVTINGEAVRTVFVNSHALLVTVRHRCVILPACIPCRFITVRRPIQALCPLGLYLLCRASSR